MGPYVDSLSLHPAITTHTQTDYTAAPDTFGTLTESLGAHHM